MPWTEKEFNHISYLAESIEERWFDRNLNNDGLEDFLKKWVTDGMNFFGWSKYEVGCMLSCLYDVEMEDGNLVFLMPPGGADTGRDELKTCMCSQKPGHDFCPYGFYCTSTPPCSVVSWTCGWFWRQECTGRCP